MRSRRSTSRSVSVSSSTSWWDEDCSVSSRIRREARGVRSWWARSELKDLSRARASLQFGQLPSVYVDNNPRAFLSTYVQTYLREEVQQEGLTRNLAAFSRFLESISFSQGQLLNVSAVARDCHVERKVVEDYVTILEDLLIGARVPPFQRRAKRRVTAHPKFYFFDAGVYRTIRPKGLLDTPEEIDGPAFETLLLQELRAHIAYLDLGIFCTFDNNDFTMPGERRCTHRLR